MVVYRLIAWRNIRLHSTGRREANGNQFEGNGSWREALVESQNVPRRLKRESTTTSRDTLEKEIERGSFVDQKKKKKKKYIFHLKLKRKKKQKEKMKKPLLLAVSSQLNFPRYTRVRPPPPIYRASSHPSRCIEKLFATQVNRTRGLFRESQVNYGTTRSRRGALFSLPERESCCFIEWEKRCVQAVRARLFFLHSPRRVSLLWKGERIHSLAYFSTLMADRNGTPDALSICLLL